MDYTLKEISERIKIIEKELRDLKSFSIDKIEMEIEHIKERLQKIEDDIPHYE